MPVDVPDALLQLMAERGGAQRGAVSLVTIVGDVASATIFVFMRRVFRAGDGAPVGEGYEARCDCAADDLARLRNLCRGSSVSRAGIRAGLPAFAVDGSAARGCAEYSGNRHDADGRGL